MLKCITIIQIYDIGFIRGILFNNSPIIMKINNDGFVKSRGSLENVIPAKAGIQ